MSEDALELYGDATVIGLVRLADQPSSEERHINRSGYTGRQVESGVANGEAPFGPDQCHRQHRRGWQQHAVLLGEHGYGIHEPRRNRIGIDRKSTRRTPVTVKSRMPSSA